MIFQDDVSHNTQPHDYLDDCPACGGFGLRYCGHTCVALPPGYVTIAYLRQLEAAKIEEGATG